MAKFNGDFFHSIFLYISLPIPSELDRHSFGDQWEVGFANYAASQNGRSEGSEDERERRSGIL